MGGFKNLYHVTALDNLEADLCEKGDPVTSAGSLGNLSAGKSGGGGLFINMEVRFPSLSKAKQKQSEVARLL